ncbi:hypothetical protein HCBG_05096 [Histoplasma capsulatum G186AR]|uniref:Uncharacterized protein n=1 Tax=Ajellomyces capsulatus (strain G186AR / H82 / ATCC MYA-2454 / RMSCC 2432) TaxID=447093 RepID=C0NPL6_AJECG|nr:uncharacterized protein HCBG_05096 [Histoplasma capsulatum G186AR]EEH06876.1 hypothetical protein HCBG_05096 [Histoplasma capsulatum G186AR]
MNLKNLFRADPMLATKCDGEASLDGNLMLLMHGIQNQAFSKTPICIILGPKHDQVLNTPAECKEQKVGA